MSEAWLALRRLVVYEAEPVRPYGSPSCQVGVLGLRAIAQNCPWMKELALTRLVCHPEEMDVLPLELLDHGLRHLSVRYGFTEEMHRGIVNRIFPHLEGGPPTLL
ncbi:uncharacterized protein TRAVEDRAFT_50249 [Trametes versicolor FP-101664 SS1]|uniref:uncharacterized protein n=1 Tax=Trametes versicolor (strain FP-101664) TaxID=717944 RepID=UPI000462382E|nr:uncharacterized protein TRAVEDRAFT_50249 [Trametes versicolor FP-101664 SS1]EIW55769.1 hypothetical protein TRAVEDRAFT_50249 [Trametes versicolor FP-101664 SS1]